MSDTRKPNLGSALRELYSQLPLRRRRQFRWTVILLSVGGVAELATIGAVYAFLALLLPQTNARVPAAVELIDFVGAQFDVARVTTAAALLISVAVVSATFRLLLARNTYKFVFGAARDLGVGLYSRMLEQPYTFHVMRNSSETLSGLEKVQHIVAYVLIPLMLAFTSAGVAFFLVAAMIALDPIVALSGALILAALYIGVTVFTRRRLHLNSQQIASALQGRVQTVQEGLGGIRDVILDQSQAVFRDTFVMIEDKFRSAQSTNYFISAAPRFVIEGSVIVLIAVLALYMSAQPGGLLGALPILGAMAIATQRLLPLVQQMYASWSNISASKAVIVDVVDLLNTPITVTEPSALRKASFRESIEFVDVIFQYPGSEVSALEDVSLQIRKGSRVGIVGRSGSGKSTLVDILMGLLEPTAGQLRIDGVPLDETRRASWRRRVAHVPQSIYLSDSSIASNIAFGRKENEIDMARVRWAARRADIHDFITALPEQYGTCVGERGTRLSGGQRQRVGIARALYKGADVLILDEATSALDDATERAILQSVAELPHDVTVVIIAHRLSTLRDCEEVVEIRSGRISRITGFEEILLARGLDRTLEA